MANILKCILFLIESFVSTKLSIYSRNSGVIHLTLHGFPTWNPNCNTFDVMTLPDSCLTCCTKVPVCMLSGRKWVLLYCVISLHRYYNDFQNQCLMNTAWWTLCLHRIACCLSNIAAVQSCNCWTWSRPRFFLLLLSEKQFPGCECISKFYEGKSFQVPNKYFVIWRSLD